MSEARARIGYWLTVGLSAVAVAVGYGIYLFAQPACGAPGNTTLGRSNRYVPWALLAVEILTVLAAGKLWRRRTSTTIIALTTASLVVIAAGVAELAWRFLSEGCFK